MKVFPERQAVRDQIDIDPHGGAFTHIDALCHMAYKGRFYNNVPFETATPGGCKLGINNLKEGIVTRAVLIGLADSAAMMRAKSSVRRARRFAARSRISACFHSASGPASGSSSSFR